MILDSLLIENYRLFRSLEIPRLSRLNLFVGKNNTGKSTILEAIQLFVTRDWSGSIRAVLGDRSENWDSRVVSGEELTASRVLRHLFHGHKLPDVGYPGIRLGPRLDRAAQVHICISAFREQQDKDGSRMFVRVAPTEVGQELGDIKLYLTIEEGTTTRRVIGLDDPPRALDRDWYRPSRVSRELRQSQLFPQAEPVLRVVPANRFELDQIAALWDSVALTEAESEIISTLKLIVPDIEGVAIVQKGERGGRIPVVKTRSASEPFSMRSMGDGLYRLFHIALSTVCSTGGVVLIDEFENGLHWTVQRELWEVLFRVTQELNVQLFATTHSTDCAKGFASVWREKQDDAAFFRLEHIDGDMRAVIYDMDMLVDSLQAGVEFR